MSDRRRQTAAQTEAPAQPAGKSPADLGFARWWDSDPAYLTKSGGGQPTTDGQAIAYWDDRIGGERLLRYNDASAPTFLEAGGLLFNTTPDKTAEPTSKALHISEATAWNSIFDDDNGGGTAIAVVDFLPVYSAQSLFSHHWAAPGFLLRPYVERSAGDGLFAHVFWGSGISYDSGYLYGAEGDKINAGLALVIFNMDRGAGNCSMDLFQAGNIHALPGFPLTYAFNSVTSNPGYQRPGIGSICNSSGVTHDSYRVTGKLHHAALHDGILTAQDKADLWAWAQQAA